MRDYSIKEQREAEAAAIKRKIAELMRAALTQYRRVLLVRPFAKAEAVA